MADQFSLSDMPWLMRDVRPGQSFDDAITTAAKMHADRRADESLAQRRMEFEAEQREKQQFDPLKMELLKQDIAMGVVKTAAVKEAREQQLRGMQDMVELGKLADNWIKTLPIEEAQKNLWGWGAKHQDALPLPAFKMIDQRMDAIRKESDNLKIKTEFGNALPQAERDEARARIFEAMGDFEMAATIRAGAKLRADNLVERKTANEIAKKSLEARTELRTTDQIQRAVFGEAKLQSEGFAPTVSLMPKGTTNALPQGAAAGQPLVKPSGVPSTVRNKIEQSQLDSENVFRAGAQLLPLLTPENVGVRGKISRLVEAVGPQLFPGMVVGTASEMLSDLNNFRSILARSMKSDGNVAQKEIDMIIAGLPHPDEMLSSVPQSKIQLIAQVEKAALLSRANAQKLGKPITPMYLTRDEIRAKIASGELNADQGAQLWQNNAWNMINTVRQSMQR